jgi:hypothetical protein
MSCAAGLPACAARSVAAPCGWLHTRSQGRRRRWLLCMRRLPRCVPTLGRREALLRRTVSKLSCTFSVCFVVHVSRCLTVCSCCCCSPLQDWPSLLTVLAPAASGRCAEVAEVRGMQAAGCFSCLFVAPSPQQELSACCLVCTIHQEHSSHPKLLYVVFAFPCTHLHRCWRPSTPSRWWSGRLLWTL